MPVHVYCMRQDVEVPDPVLPATVSRAYVDPDVGTSLRRLNSDETSYDAGGMYYEAEVVSPNLVGEKITELYAVQVFWGVEPVIADLPAADRASIGLQVSNDGGATWLVWQDSVSSWVPATGPLLGFFNDLLTVDARIPLLPWTDPHQVRFRVKLVPGAGGKQRPVVYGIALFNRHDMDISEDCARSVKRHLDRTVKVPMYYMAELAAPTTAITIDSGIGLDVTVREPIRVFNLTTDPARNFNLFSSLSGRTITMASAQVGQVEVQFTGVPDVFIGAEEFFQISKMPSIVVFTPTLDQYTPTRHWWPEPEVSVARGVGRNQRPRQFYKISMAIRVQSSLNREARQMTDAAVRVLEVGMFFDSVANGEKYCVYSVEGNVREDRVAQGIWVGAVNLVVFGKMWTVQELPGGEGEDEVAIVKKIVAQVGAQHTCNLLLPEHLRRVYRERIEVSE